MDNIFNYKESIDNYLSTLSSKSDCLEFLKGVSTYCNSIILQIESSINISLLVKQNLNIEDIELTLTDMQLSDLETISDSISQLFNKNKEFCESLYKDHHELWIEKWLDTVGNEGGSKYLNTGWVAASWDNHDKIVNYISYKVREKLTN